VTKEYWQVNTDRIAQAIRDAAGRAVTEEDLKMAIEPIIQGAMKQMGLDTSSVRYEKTSTRYGGRSDSVYGFLTIEYKSPGKLDARGVSEQLQRYLSAEAEQFRGQREDYLEKAVGVATDGREILFVRFSKTATALQLPQPQPGVTEPLFPELGIRRGFQVLGPYPMTPQSVANLLIHLRATDRQPLTAQNLASVFAPPGDIACQAVSELYGAVTRSQRQQASPRIKAFFHEWDRVFGIVYGQELNKAELAAARTAAHYHLPAGARLKELLFAIHTYYAFLMKLVAIELVALQRDSKIESFIAGLNALENDELRERLASMEAGEEFSAGGIINFLEADFFSWYLDAWGLPMSRVVRSVIQGLTKFEPATPVLEPEWTRDLLQNLYEDIVPHDLRHALGEFYTPDWLAGYLVDRTGYKGVSSGRFLDPSCGTGTIIVQAINRAIQSASQVRHPGRATIGRDILKSIVGFDLNPLAVLAARTNYLIAFARFIPSVRPISIPVYLCDSVRAPSRYVDENQLGFDSPLVFATSKADYEFPLAMNNQEQIDKFTGMVDVSLRGGHRLTIEQFRRRVETEFELSAAATDMLVKVYKTIKKLDEADENGFWARYIKNAFAPVYLEKFDYVVGNPPWIRWGYLADDYRKGTLKLWHRYGLFSLKGHETRLGAGEKDFSMLFTYACADNYLKDGGKLGFLITMEVFKSKGAGEGFRGFEIKDKRVPLKMLRLDDMVDLQPFRAANKTALFVLKKGARTKYPVPVLEWKRKQGIGRIPTNWRLEQVLTNTTRTRLVAIPVNPDKPVSSWQTSQQDAISTLAKLKGECHYTPHLGARVEPYGVFWLKVNEVWPNGQLSVTNLHDRGKRVIKPVTTHIESTLVFPAVAGGNICRFGVKSHFEIVMSQNPKTRKPYPEDWMLDHAPLTLAYLGQFKKELLSRGSRLVREFAEATEFYAMYGIGPYSVAKYRVTWKRMASRVEAVVLSNVRTQYGTKPMISTDTTAFFAVDNRAEAHYLCAILNSQIVDSYIRSFSSAGRGFGAPSVMSNLAIPEFDTRNKLHAKLADLSEQAHDLVKNGKPADDVERQIDEAARKLWNIKS
jgi:hypothetical protein